MKDKKILFLIPTLDSGGGERVVSELSLNLPSRFQRTIVLFENKVSYPYKGKLISLNISLSKRFFPKLFNLFIGLWRFKKIVNEEKPDYVISFGKAPNIFNILTESNSIVRIENSLTERKKGFWARIYNFLIKTLFNKAEKVIVVSKALGDDLIKDFRIRKEKIKLIYNPIDIKKIQELLKEPLELKHQEIFKQPVIINVGRLTEQKGQWHLVRAFKKAKERKKDLKLVILGEGELETYLKRLIKNLNLEKDVYFLGWQKNPFKFLSRSKLFVFPSLWEGLGIAILEAMVCGLPVISSDCKSGPREILAPSTDLDNQTKNIEYVKYGILVPVCSKNLPETNTPLTRNENILSKATIEVLTNEKLSNDLATKAKQRAKDFDIRNIIKKWDF